MRELKPLAKGEFTHCEKKIDGPPLAIDRGPAAGVIGPATPPTIGRVGASTTLTPEQRQLRARVAAYARHAQHDAVESTAAARAAGPAGDKYWLDRVDPDGALDQDDRERRARAAKAEYFNRIAYLSSRARRARTG